jgi:hypothetical protein
VGSDWIWHEPDKIKGARGCQQYFPTYPSLKVSSDGKSRSLPMMRPEKRPFEEPPATLAGQEGDNTIVNK